MNTLFAEVLRQVVSIGGWKRRLLPIFLNLLNIQLFHFVTRHTEAPSVVSFCRTEELTAVLVLTRAGQFSLSLKINCNNEVILTLWRWIVREACLRSKARCLGLVQIEGALDIVGYCLIQPGVREKLLNCRISPYNLCFWKRSALEKVYICFEIE